MSEQFLTGNNRLHYVFYAVVELRLVLPVFRFCLSQGLPQVTRKVGRAAAFQSAASEETKYFPVWRG